MKVSDLIAKLQQLPPDAEIWSAGNWDGNADVWVKVEGQDDVYLIDDGQ